MKLYINAAIAPYQSLKTWMEANKDTFDDNAVLTIFDMQNYALDDEVPGCMFVGTMFELRTGIGENFFVPDEDYDLDSYYQILDEYEFVSIKQCQNGEYEIVVLHNW